MTARRSHWPAITIVAMLLVFLYTPIITVIIFSFNASRYSSHWQGFSWHWYQQMLHDPGLMAAAIHSIVIALTVGMLTPCLASIMTFCIHYYRGWNARIHTPLLACMMIAPDLCIAAGYALATHFFHWSLGLTPLIIAHIALCLPLTVFLQTQQFNRIPRSLFAVAKDLGANDWQCMRHIALPLMRSSLLTSSLLCMVLSLDDAVISYFLTGPSFETLPVYLFALIKTGITPVVNAISTIILLTSIAMIVVANHIGEIDHAH